MPAFTARSDVELLESSGIVDGTMVANVRCNGCSDIDISSFLALDLRLEDGIPSELGQSFH
ncbi:hypothetical protein E4U58_000153 [Claviceps cyperi]|nr:hypothetical protein E4U58_000153 [Claviceps cyperi]